LDATPNQGYEIIGAKETSYGHSGHSPNTIALGLNQVFQHITLQATFHPSQPWHPFVFPHPKPGIYPFFAKQSLKCTGRPFLSPSNSALGNLSFSLEILVCAKGIQ